MRSRLLSLLAIALLAAWPVLAQEHPKSGSEHPEEKSEKKSEKAAAKLTTDQLADAIEAYITEDAKLHGGPFLVYDAVDKKPLQLALVKVHRDKLASLGGGVYFACTDMKETGGTLYDLDFFMKQGREGLETSEIAVHKKSGQPRYTWKEENGVWMKVKN